MPSVPSSHARITNPVAVPASSFPRPHYHKPAPPRVALTSLAPSQSYQQPVQQHSYRPHSRSSPAPPLSSYSELSADSYINPHQFAVELLSEPPRPPRQELSPSLRARYKQAQQQQYPLSRQASEHQDPLQQYPPNPTLSYPQDQDQPCTPPPQPGYPANGQSTSTHSLHHHASTANTSQAVPSPRLAHAVLSPQHSRQPSDRAASRTPTSQSIPAMLSYQSP